MPPLPHTKILVLQILRNYGGMKYPSLRFASMIAEMIAEGLISRSNGSPDGPLDETAVELRAT